MKPLILLFFICLWLFICRIVFRKAERDYLKLGKLSSSTAFGQFMVFFLHAQLFNLSYWNILTFRYGKILSFSYWIETGPSLSRNFVFVALGIIIAAIGITILAAGIGVFGSFRRMTGLKIDGLRVAGIYRWTRNPQIIGYGLLVFSIPLIWNSIYALCVSLVYWLGTHMMVLAEEKHLQRSYAEAYRAYCASTPRYISVPFLRNRNCRTNS